MKKTLVSILFLIFAVKAGAADFQDSVKKVRDDEEGTVVMFTNQTSMFYLKKENKKFDEIRNKLKSLQGKKKPVNVSVDAQQTILDVK